MAGLASPASNQMFPPPPLTTWQIIWRNALALMLGLTVFGTNLKAQWTHAHWLVLVDLVGGVVMTVAYQFRRRWPFQVAMLGALLSAVSTSSSGAGVLAYISLSTRRRWSEIISVGIVSLICGQLFYTTQPPINSSWYETVLTGLAVSAISAAIGMYIGARRDLLATLKDRAERAEREQELHVARAQAEERTRIAREMHDVLAHRMSLVAMHAGALAYRDNLTPDETRSTAEVIQANSHRALTDLREILGVLRDKDASLLDEGATHRPQPTLCDIDELVSDERAAGARVKLVNELDRGKEVPQSIGRATYRLVQESLTNARKHSPDTQVFITISGAPGVGLNVEVRNPIRVGMAEEPAVPIAPGAGLGLIGLGERVTLARGRFEHGRTPAGDFVVRAWLPWDA